MIEYEWFEIKSANESLTQQRWERWKAGKTDESHQFATDERADEESCDTKEVASRKTFVLGDGPHRSEKDGHQKDWGGHKHQAADGSNTASTRTWAENIPSLTFGDERSQEASRRTRTESAKQGAAHHWRVGVGASIHHWVSGDKIGGLLCDIGTGAAPHYNLDLIHIQVLEISGQEQVVEVFVILWYKDKAENSCEVTHRSRYNDPDTDILGQTRNA